jgi:hypothetical protein
MAQKQYLLIEQFDAVRRITINRPDVRNAQSRLVLEQLDAAGADAAADPATRVIILAGAGRDFSAGHDLGSPDELEDRRLNPRSPRAADEYLRIARLNLDMCNAGSAGPAPGAADGVQELHDDDPASQGTRHRRRSRQRHVRERPDRAHRTLN